MTITVYMAYWENYFSLSPLLEDEAYFKRVGNMSMIFEGRHVFISPDPEGSPAVDMLDRERQGGLGIRYKWHIGKQPWARFMRHETEVVLEDDGSIMWSVPPDHELTWPKVRPAGALNVSLIIAREFRLRVRSAYAETGRDGMEDVIRGVPDVLKKLADRSEWSSIIRETLQMERT